MRSTNCSTVAWRSRCWRPRTFSADLTVRPTDVGDGPAARPVLSFTLPAGQRLTEVGRDGQPRQAGRRVTLRLPASTAGGHPVTLTLRGTYNATVPGVADDFTVDGLPCARTSTSVILTPPVSATKDDSAASTAEDDRGRRRPTADAAVSAREKGRPATTPAPGGARSSPGSTATSAAPTPTRTTPSSPAPATSTAAPSPTVSPDPEPTGTGEPSSSPAAGPTSEAAATPSPTT